MRTIECTNLYDEMLETGVDVKLHEKTRIVYVSEDQANRIPAIAIPSGVDNLKSRLDGFYGHLANNVEPFNEQEIDEFGNSRRKLKRLEVHAVSNIDEVAQGGAPKITGSSGDPKKRGKKQLNVQGFRTPREASAPSAQFMEPANSMS